MDILVSGLMAYDWTMDFPGRFSDQLLATQKPRDPASLIPRLPVQATTPPLVDGDPLSVNSYVSHTISTIPCLFPFALRGLLNSQDRLLACIPYHQE